MVYEIDDSSGLPKLAHESHRWVISRFYTPIGLLTPLPDDRKPDGSFFCEERFRISIVDVDTNDQVIVSKIMNKEPTNREAIISEALSLIPRYDRELMLDSFLGVYPPKRLTPLDS